MKYQCLLLPLLIIGVFGFLVKNSGQNEMSKLKIGDFHEQIHESEGMKYNGKGFTHDLQSILSEAINDAAIYYNDNYSAQAKYISGKMKEAKEGDWHIVLIQNLNITKVTDVSTGFFYWNQNDTWALWHSTSHYAPLVLHLVIYNGNNGKSVNSVTTKESTVGSNVNPDTASVISSIVKTLDTTQDIAKYIQKYDGQKWSVLSVPFTWGNKYPEAWASLSVSGVYVTYHENVTLDRVKYSQLIFV